MNIKLKCLELKDAKEILEAVKETNFKYNRMSNEINLFDEKKWLKKEIKKHKNKIVQAYKIVNEKKIVGIITLKMNQEQKYLCELGYWIRKSEQGKNIATKATKEILKEARKINLTGVQAVVDPKNIASQRVLEKNGFKKIGLLKKYVIINGKLKDRLFYWKTI